MASFSAPAQDLRRQEIIVPISMRGSDLQAIPPNIDYAAYAYPSVQPAQPVQPLQAVQPRISHQSFPPLPFFNAAPSSPSMQLLRRYANSGESNVTFQYRLTLMPLSGLTLMPISGFTLMPISGLTLMPLSGFTLMPISGFTLVPISGFTLMPVCRPNICLQ